VSEGQRKQWIIDRRLQLRFILVLVCIGFLNFLFYILSLHFFFSELRGFYEAVQVVSGVKAQALASQRLLFYKAAIVGFVLQTLLIALLGVYFSNRISGPIYRLSNALKKLAQGEGVEPIKLRKHDFMEEVTDNFNKALERFFKKPTAGSK
jgi:methyl-accepting chemotaxis protein